jgi:GH35 family endo-1,4-beta-xylanase
MIKSCFIIYSLLLISQMSIGQSLYDSLWGDEQLNKRIEEGIQKNRKGDLTLRLLNDKGQALKNVEVHIVQLKHEFLFGSNLFMLKGFRTEEENKKYEQTFLSLFNHGSIPFYWKPLEPTQGNLRFESNSEPIYRRPPPDLVVDFCEKNQIYPKGHTLVWDNPRWAIPTWLPQKEELIQPLINQRISTIAQRYGNKIQMWDVVNEIKNRHMEVVMPKDFALKAFEQAEENFPKSSILMINETTSIWYDRKREYSFYYMTIENLLLKKARIDAIGLQCHFFHSEEEFRNVVQGKSMKPKEIFEVLDTYALFGKPLHITEVTIPTIPNSKEGEALQAKITKNLYRIWFSYPNVQSIVWWNIADGTAAPGEDKWLGGFLREDMTEKPSYQILNDLINKEWKSNMKLKIQQENIISANLFYGKYLITIIQGKKIFKQEINFTQAGQKELEIQAKF